MPIMISACTIPHNTMDSRLSSAGQSRSAAIRLDDIKTLLQKDLSSASVKGKVTVIDVFEDWRKKYYLLTPHHQVAQVVVDAGNGMAEIVPYF